MIASKKKVFDTVEQRGWFTIHDINDLVAVGKRMHNALTMPSFAKMYGEDMHLFFLMEGEEVLVNASFKRSDLTPHMIVGPKNAAPDTMFAEDIRQLHEYVAANLTADSASATTPINPVGDETV